METPADTFGPDSIRIAIRSGEPGEVRKVLDGMSYADVGLAVSRLNGEERRGLFDLLGAEDAADWVGGFGFPQMVQTLADLPHDLAAAILDRFPSDLQADVLAEFSRDRAEAVIKNMSEEDAMDARILLQYDPETAGGIMVREYLSFSVDQAVQDVLDDLRGNRETYSGYDVQYAYVTGSRGELAGVLRMRDLLLASPLEHLARLMIPEPLSVRAETGLPGLNEIFSEFGFLGIPVIDAEDRLVGVVLRSHLEEANRDEATGNFLKVSGLLGEDELRSMPLRLRAGRRLMWLSINIVLNLIAASVIALNEDVLAKVIAIAVFLPIISDMSGCSGNQAVGVSIRELSLNLIRPNEFVRVFLKESAVGLFNGLILGCLIGLIAAIYEGSFYFGLVIGLALYINTVVSVCLGGIIPLVLRGFKLDPALASAPILTTVTDMCGFFFVLTFASAMMPFLVPS